MLHASDDPDVSLWMQDLEHVSMESVKHWRMCDRLSLSDILLCCDPSTSFLWRKQINMEIGIAKMCEVGVLKGMESRCCVKGEMSVFFRLSARLCPMEI